MKVLIISTLYYPDHLGGAEISTQILAENLAKSFNYDITILSHGKENSEEIINRVKVIRKYFGISTDIVYSNISGKDYGIIDKFKGKISDITRNRKLIDYYRRSMCGYDVIIVSGNARNMGRRNIWLSAYKENIPLIQIVRDPVLLFYKDGLPSSPKILDRAFRFFSKKDLDKVPFVVGPTKTILDNHEKYGVHFNHKTVIPNIVIVDNPHSYSYQEKENSVIYVGSISKPKGSVTLIDAIQKIHEKLPSIKLVLVGKNTGIKIPKEEYIFYKGHMDIDKVFDEMARAKLLVLPSEWEEAFGRTVVEAIFNGTLAICSDAGGVHELLNDDPDFVFESGNVDSLCSMIVKIMSYDYDNYAINLTKQKGYSKRFSLNENIDLWKNYLDSIY